MDDEFCSRVENTCHEIVLVLMHSWRDQDAAPGSREGSGEIVALECLGCGCDEINELTSIVLGVGEEGHHVGAEQGQHAQDPRGR